MRRILFDSPRASKRFLRAFFATSVAISSTFACQSKVQNTSVDAGGGFRKGKPPMCYQYKAESRATAAAYDIWLHFNNTCSYTVDCLVYDDVTEKQLHVVQPAYQANQLLLVMNVPNKRVDVEFECTWKP